MEAMKPRPAIVLLSGGLDSATTLAIARVAGYAPLYTLAFDYGQRHRYELTRARKLADLNGARHRQVTIDLRQFGGSALTDDIDVPKDSLAEPGTGGIPITYVPARNTVFLSFALAWAEVIDADDVFIGVNALDYSGYPDCRPEYVEAFEAMARLGTKRTRFNVHAPLVHLTKAQIIRRGIELGVDYSVTLSCYDPIEKSDGAVLSCGHCDACILRKRGFAEAGVHDPTMYVM
jgi:7-cyano-7-deazaguanine synthase